LKPWTKQEEINYRRSYVPLLLKAHTSNLPQVCIDQFWRDGGVSKFGIRCVCLVARNAGIPKAERACVIRAIAKNWDAIKATKIRIRKEYLGKRTLTNV
jgi:hypothetical protein